MKIYFRLLRYCLPLADFIPVYMLVSILAIVFGLLNFTLLIPLLDILFAADKNAVIPAAAPDFTFSGDWIKETFNYYFLSRARTHGHMNALYWVCGVLIGSVVIANIFRYISAVMVENLRARAVRNIRNAVFSKAMALHLGYFSNERKGDLMARLTTDVQEVDYTVANTFATLLKEPLTLIAYLITLFMLSYKLTLFAFIIIPVSAIIIGAINKKLRKQSRLASDQQGHLLTLTDEALSAIRIIKAFNARAFMVQRYEAANQHLKNIISSINRRKEAASPFSEFSGVTIVAIILVYGGSLVLEGTGELSASAFVAYLAIFSQIMRPAKAISQSFSNINRGLASGERILQVVDAPNLVTDAPNALGFAGVQQGIEFRNVSFAYGEREVVSGVSFTIKKGQTVALVGPSGGGKSTLADLALRLYDPTGGQLLVDGIDLRTIRQEDFRRYTGLVSQDTVLFNDTVAANIAFANPDAPLAQIEHAAKVAYAHDFITAMEKGYYTLIGDRGGKLSGGQRQRLAIARAIMADPQFLILDEATSALDSQSEQAVQNALDVLLKDRTSLVIAHRLSTIRHADVILVVENGQIVETGTHEELITKSGLYSKLAVLQ